MAKDPYRFFRVEARDLLEQLGRAALDLERGPEPQQAVARLLRLAHTLKGAARVVRQREIADHAHAIEDLLAPLRDAAQGAPAGLVDGLLALLDRIGTGLESLALPAPAAATDAAPAAAPGDVERIVRADVADVDALLGGIAQAHGRIAALQRGLDDVDRACGLADTLADQLAPRRRDARAPALGPAHSLAAELRAALGAARRGLTRCAEQADRELRWVREAAEQLRLVPAALLFAPLERTARDDARALGRQVVFEARGADVRLDAGILETIQGALLQMVRNAIAHGIEPEPARRAAAKPAAGLVVVEVARRGRHWVFSCTDDGAGVDLDAVRGAARRRGWAVPAANRELDAQALLQLLMRPGLSTAPELTEVAGRGVGLDVVREAVERLGGSAAVRTAAGRGTTLELTVPMSLVSFDALAVEVAGRVLAIPLDAVRCTLRRGTHEIARTAQGETLPHEGEAVAFAWLARLLDEARPAQGDGAFSAVLVEGAEGLAAIGVDRLLGTAHVVQRPLPELAPAAAVVAGASLDAEGQPQIVLDPDGLVARALRTGPPRRDDGPAPEPPRILVIDDSLTSRMLEKSILESAGYLVHTAACAEDGLEQARRERYALFLVDVEMPGMDGFEFVERAGIDASLRGTPAILVTSRCAPEDRRRGEQAGARGYIVKSEFAQTDFLRRVRELVAAP